MHCAWVWATLYWKISSYNLVSMPRRKPGTLLPLEHDLLAAAIEHQLGRNQPTYGYQLAKAIAESSNGLLAHGTLYKALGRLVDRGLMEASWEHDPPPSRPRRRLYLVTGAGIQANANRPELMQVTRPQPAILPEPLT